jgi:Tfp pilus assembly protein PilN
MFKIDLLKGQGIPPRSRPEPIAAAVILIALPVIVVAFMLTSFYVNRIDNSYLKREIDRMKNELSTGNMSVILEQQKALEQQRKDLSDSLSEVSSVIDNQTQWSTLLLAIVKDLPPSVTLRSAYVTKENTKKTRSDPVEKDKVVEFTVPVRVLHLSLASSDQRNFDKVVKDYRDNLLIDPNVGPRLDSKKISVAQESNKATGEKEMITYEISMTLL